MKPAPPVISTFSDIGHLPLARIYDYNYFSTLSAPKPETASIAAGGDRPPGHSSREPSARTAGPSSTSPSRASKREPWQGQSQVRSAALKETMQPRWVQRAESRGRSPSSSRE